MKAIIFDMGGVLLDLDIERCKSAFKENLEFMEIDTLLDPCHQKGIIGDMEGGLVSGEEFCGYVKAASREGTTDEDVKTAFRKIVLGMAPYKGQMLQKLAEKYDLYILSNNNPIVMPFAEELFNSVGFPLDRFKKSFLSYEMKMLKPSDEMFKAVMNDIGLPAEEMFFIDDSQSNVDASIAAGLPAVYYKPGTDLDALIASVL